MKKTLNRIQFKKLKCIYNNSLNINVHALHHRVKVIQIINLVHTESLNCQAIDFFQTFYFYDQHPIAEVYSDNQTTHGN